MVDKTEFGTVLAWLAALYPGFSLQEMTVRAYYEILHDLPVDLLKAAALKCGAEVKFFPAAAELRAAAFALGENGSGPPTAGEAWSEALKRVNIYDPPSPGDFSHPLVYEALQAIGGNWVLGMTDQGALSVVQSHFVKAYKALDARRREEMTMLPQVREIAARLRSSGAERDLLPWGEEQGEATPDTHVP